MKTFTEARIRDLIGEVSTEKISFSKMVEIINKECCEKMILEIDDIIKQYGNNGSKNGGYSKLLRNKRTTLMQLKLSYE